MEIKLDFGNENMKKKIGIYFVYLLFFITFIFMVCVVMIYNDNYSDIIEYKVEKNYLKNGKNELVSLYDIKNFKNSNTNIIICGNYSKYANAYTEDLKSADVYCIFTDECFKEVYDLNIIEGNFFDTSMKVGYIPVVINLNLSREIFPLGDVINKSLRVDGYRYKIVGVCKNKYNTNNYIYIPYDYLVDNDKIYFENISLKRGNKSKFSIQNNMPSGLQKKLNNYECVDYSTILGVVFGFFYIYMIFMIINIFLLISNIIKKAIKNINKNISILIALVFLLIISCIIMLNTPFPINIFNSTNIFDFKSLWNNYLLVEKFNDNCSDVFSICVTGNIVNLSIIFNILSYFLLIYIIRKKSIQKNDVILNIFFITFVLIMTVLFCYFQFRIKLITESIILIPLVIEILIIFNRRLSGDKNGAK